MSAKRRKVIVSYDYLDGIMGVFVRKPESYDESYRMVDVTLIDQFEQAQVAFHAAQDALYKAFCSAPDTPNPKYENTDGDAG